MLLWRGFGAHSSKMHCFPFVFVLYFAASCLMPSARASAQAHGSHITFVILIVTWHASSARTSAQTQGCMHHFFQSVVRISDYYVARVKCQNSVSGAGPRCHKYRGKALR